MDVSVLKNHIKNKDFQKFYIFAGEEWKVQQLYIEQIVKVSGKQKKSIDDIKRVFSTLKGNSFIKQSFVYVLRDDKTILTDEKLQERLPSVLDDNILILILTSLDKRTKFYKKYNDDIYIFERLKPQVLKKYIQKEIPLSDQSCEKLVEVCENDYGRCLLEIDKMKHYSDGVEDKAYNHILEELLKKGTIYQPPYDAIFDFVDAVLRRQTKRAFNLLHQSYAVGEATMVLLSVLYNNAKQVLQVQTCAGKDISKATGMTGWQIKCAKEKAGYYDDEELMRLMALIHKCESGIKSGKIEENITIEYILVHIL